MINFKAKLEGRSEGDNVQLCNKDEAQSSANGDDVDNANADPLFVPGMQ